MDGEGMEENFALWIQVCDDMTPEPPLGEEGLVEIDPLALAEQWFLGEYHAEYLADRLNYGGGPDDGSWFPHVGEKAQARADAERIVTAIGADRLIAALRASRERVKELEAEVEEWKDAHWGEVGY